MQGEGQSRRHFMEKHLVDCSEIAYCDTKYNNVRQADRSMHMVDPSTLAKAVPASLRCHASLASMAAFVGLWGLQLLL